MHFGCHATAMALENGREYRDGIVSIEDLSYRWSLLAICVFGIGWDGIKLTWEMPGMNSL